MSLFLLLLIGIASPASTDLYFAWDGVAGAATYEIEIGSDRRFTEAKRIPLDAPNARLSHSGAVANARARAVFSDGKTSAWNAIVVGKWAAPRVLGGASKPPDTIRVTSAEAGTYALRWTAPANAPVGEMRYQVRIRDSDGHLLHDAVSRSPVQILPSLPAGDYSVEIEAIGIPSLGTVRRLGDAVARVVLKAEAPDPPEIPRTGPEWLSRAVDPFRPGITLGATAFGAAGPWHRVAGTIAELGIGVPGGIRLQGSLPTTFLEGGRNAGFDGRSPRLGGGPFPELGAAIQVTGEEFYWIGLGGGARVPLDTSGIANRAQTAVYAEGTGRVEGEGWWLDFRAAFGGVAPRELGGGNFVRARPYIKIEGIPAFVAADRVAARARLLFESQGDVFLTAANSILLQLSERVTIEPEIRATYGLAAGEPPWELRLSGRLLF